MTASRRLALPLSLLVLCALAVVQLESLPPAEGPGPPPQTQPNIVFILTDDQDLELGSMDFMPLTRELIARQGMTFTQHFVPLSLCCPSRATILTGLYPHNHQVYTNNRPDGGFERFADLGLEETTVGTALHSAGYRTALLGKYLNHYPRGSEPTHLPPGWDEFVSPVAGGVYSGFDYTLNDNGTRVHHARDPKDYMTDVLAGRATDFIRRSAGTGQPFFLYLAPYAPHVPSTPAPRHARLFRGLKAPRTPSFNEANVRDKPLRLPLLTPAEIAQIDGQYRLRAQALQAVDEAVAAIVHTLEDTGQLANTYIFFTSDNGYHMGQHRLRPGKYTIFEEDVHVPLLVRGPGVPAGSSTSLATSSVDFAPTFAALAGAPLKRAADGRSLVLILHGRTPDAWRQVILLEQFGLTPDDEPQSDVLEPPDPQDEVIAESPAHLGVRTPDLKYVEYASGVREVYDLKRDPDELVNLAGRADPAWMAAMSSLARSLESCAADSCRQREAVAPPRLPPVVSQR